MMNDTRIASPDAVLAEQVHLHDVTAPAAKPEWIVVLEIAVILSAAVLIDYLLFDGTRFRQTEPHPFWILILVISAQYGTRMGLLAALAASAVFVFGNVPARALDQDIYQWFFLVFRLPIMWIVSSVIIGELSVRHINARQYLSEQIDEYILREATLSESFHEINSIKEKLEIRVAGQSRTVRKMLKAAREMESDDPMLVLEHAQNLVDCMLEPDKYSIYIFKDNQLQLAFNHGWEPADEYRQNFDAEDQLFKSIVWERNTLCIAVPADELILEQQGLLAGPLVIPESGELFGMLKIEKQTFSQLSLNTIKDFNSIRDWIGAVYGKAETDSLQMAAIDHGVTERIKKIV